MDGKSSNWRPGPSVCRCCLSDGCYKDIATEYFWMGKREVYEEMLVDTLGLTISFGDSNAQHSQSRLICETCISRLRNATDFKKQVKECEQTFLQYLNPSTLDVVEDVISLEKEEKQVTVKEEKSPDHGDDFNDNNDFLDDDNDDELDDQPLMNLATKVPKKESVDVFDLLDNAKPLVKRKSTTKAKTTSSKKAKIKETKTKPKEKPEKKKKELCNSYVVAKRNAELLVQSSTVYPFRLPEESMVCVYCCEKVEEPSKYRQHMVDEHPTFNSRMAFAHVTEGFIKADCSELQCRLCPMAFDTLETIAQHLVDVHDKDIDLHHDLGIQPFKLQSDKLSCALCNAKAICLRQLSRHTQTHFTKYTCEACGKSYSTCTSLKHHITFSHSGGNRVCRKCKKTFETLEEKRQHVSKSKKCWSHLCNVCGERFFNWTNKNNHLFEVHGVTRKNYVCPECSLVFVDRKKYRAHFKLSHTEDVYICTCCGLKFETKKHLDEHRVIHTKEKPFPCPVCTKSFARKKNLIQHLWIHSELKRFSCTLCSKQFNQRVTWKTHMRSYHPEIENFESMHNKNIKILLSVVKSDE
ncbi:zinc finger protein 652-B-like isoform X7 [Leptidea sinapis]|uniref:zinc finger protein 652-B-like isoform X7 n=1 Tax=Leptidea sinapis TaxID=189913 RepID=UPI0021C47317|nr:zinc finger protein 652-B-like isoform X7 [Leptidea sinapis]